MSPMNWQCFALTSQINCEEVRHNFNQNMSNSMRVKTMVLRDLGVKGNIIANGVNYYLGVIVYNHRTGKGL